jgi:DNA-damage-inducible protein J
MAAKSALVHVRIDEDLKDQAAAVLAEYGLNVSDATRILLTRIAKDGVVPPILLATKSDYDSWFRAKVQEAMDDPRPGIPHEQVMADIRGRLARGRQTVVAAVDAAV